MSKQADTVSLPVTYLHSSWPKWWEFFKPPSILFSLYYVIFQGRKYMYILYMCKAENTCMYKVTCIILQCGRYKYMYMSCGLANDVATAFNESQDPISMTTFYVDIQMTSYLQTWPHSCIFVTYSMNRQHFYQSYLHGTISSKDGNCWNWW